MTWFIFSFKLSYLETMATRIFQHFYSWMMFAYFMWGRFGA